MDKLAPPQAGAPSGEPGGRARFTTGAMRLEDDRRTITVPVIGPLCSKENTRRLARPLAQGRAHILNITRDWPDHASLGLVEAQAPNVSSPAGSGGDVGSGTGTTGAGGATVRLGVKPEPVAARPEPTGANQAPEEPRQRGAA